jgi:hypothetical protein
MLIDINQEKWEEIKSTLLDRGMLSRAATVRGKLLQFPEPVWSLDICVGSED